MGFIDCSIGPIFGWDVFSKTVFERTKKVIGEKIVPRGPIVYIL